ncbi:MAG: hypothetical protein AABY22_14665, partial [Nanoarchaeota archaeon]
IQDVLISMALSNVLSYQGLYPDVNMVPVPKILDEEFVTSVDYKSLLAQHDPGFTLLRQSQDVGYIIYCLMNGIYTGDMNYSIVKAFENDHERILQALQVTDSLVAHWGKELIWKTLGLRLTYKVPLKYVSLVQIDGIGKARASKMYHGDIKTPEDVVNHPDVVTTLLGKKMGPKTVAFAKQMIENKTFKTTQEDVSLIGIHGGEDNN